MKFLLDFFPLIVFVGVYSYASSEQPMYPAVQALMAASVIHVIGSRLLSGKFEKLPLWILLITIVFGTLTLVFRDPMFVQWKASIVVWLMALIFLFRQFYSKKLLIQEALNAALEESMDVPDKVWKSINLSWPIAYIIFGFLSLYIAFNFAEAFWVKFKLFGLLGLNLVLLFYTIYKLYPYFPEEKNEPESITTETTEKED